METCKTSSKAAPRSTDRFLGRRIHLIGIGGSGMRALAETLLRRGAVVSGSDMCSSKAVDELSDLGANVHVGQQESNLPGECDVVVRSAAIHEQNPELVAARSRGVEILKYSQMLGCLMAEHAGIAVAGTHGKSTTSAMVAYALTAAGDDPSFIIGATVEQLGGPSGVGAGPHFIAEACEFDRSFLHLCPKIAAILNVEEDHLDCYADLDAIVEAFRAFASRVAPEGVLIVNGEDAEAIKAAAGRTVGTVETFGFEDNFDWHAGSETVRQGCFEMDVRYRGRDFARIALRLPGRHNAYNALAAAALLHHAGLDTARISAGLDGFSGVHRRQSLRGEGRGVRVVDDYAHHPTEIAATLRALSEYYQPKRLLCVFQPHQHSRTRFLLKDFARSFNLADEVLVPEIFFVRDSARERDCISSDDLVSQIRFNGGTAVYLKTFDEIVERLQRTLKDGDVLVTMGAGNVWEIADEVVRWLGTDR